MKFLLVLAVLVQTSIVLAKAPKFETNRFFVKLKEGKDFPAVKSIKSQKKLFKNVYLVETDNLAKAEAELKATKEVRYLERSYLAGARKLETPSLKPAPIVFGASNTVFNDPKVDRLWAFRQAGKGGMDVNKSYKSPLRREKSEVIVAVVDTGVDYNHADLKNVMWINENEIPGNGIDDDNNGYVDDVHGIDTLTRNEDGVASGDPNFSHAHGTHVAGTIAAEQNNNIGIAGVASKVKIMAIRTVPDNGDETDVDIVESFLYAAKHGAKIINCSFGKKKNEGGMIVSETIQHIGETYGTLVVAAAGNDYQTNIDVKKKYPASFENDNLLVVASMANGGRMSFFSNIGKKNVDIAAPGSDILSTIPKDRYDTFSGTSMATPNAVGVAAEVLSHFPDLGPLELKKVLMDSVTPKKGLKNKTVSGGIVNLHNALRTAEKL